MYIGKTKLVSDKYEIDQVYASDKYDFNQKTRASIWCVPRATTKFST